MYSWKSHNLTYLLIIKTRGWSGSSSRPGRPINLWCARVCAAWVEILCDTQLAGEYRINCISLLILSISMWTLGSFPCVHILEATQESEVVREISLGMRQTHWVCRLCQCTEGTDYFHVDIGFLSPCVQPAVTQLSTVTQPIIFFLRRLSLSQDDIMCIKLK